VLEVWKYLPIFPHWLLNIYEMLPTLRLSTDKKCAAGKKLSLTLPRRNLSRNYNYKTKEFTLPFPLNFWRGVAGVWRNTE